MTTSPWSSDTETITAAGALTHVSSVFVTTPAGDEIPVPVVAGSLTFDDTASPRVSLTVATHLDRADPAQQNRMDPRLACRVHVALGYQRPDGTTDLHPVADLGLRSRPRERPADELTITARSDEALLLDNSPSSTLTVAAADTAQAIEAIIHMVLPSATVTIDVTDDGPAQSVSGPDLSKMGTLQDFADQIEAQVYDDGTRAWWIVDRGSDYGTPVATLSDGPTGTLTGLTEDNDRDGDWFNRVKLVHTWTVSDVDHRIVSVKDATGPFAPVTGNVRVLEVERDTPITQTQADKAATALVKRTVTRGRTLQLSAPSLYWVRPGDTITVHESDRDPEAHLVQSVTFDLRTGLMSVTTRQPE